MAGIVLAAGLALATTAQAAAEPGWRASVEAFAAQHFRHPAWGAAHSRRDYALARELAAQDKVAVDDDVLFAAAYLHDIAAFAPWENPDPKVDHSDVGADALGPVLVKLGFPAAKIAAVRDATRTHMFYRKAETPEAVYLHDADALDWLGAIGVARMLATIDPPAPVQDLKKAVAAIEANLADAPAGVQSPAGKARVPGMVAEARDFLARLKAESVGGDAL